MKKYTKPSMEIVDLRVEDKITADTTFYRRGINLLENAGTGIIDNTVEGAVNSSNASF